MIMGLTTHEEASMRQDPIGREEKWHERRRDVRRLAQLERERGKNMNQHKCPRCGTPTSGSWSEGGIKWAICEDCMADNLGPQEPPDDPTIFNRRMPDGSFRSLSEFFDVEKPPIYPEDATAEIARRKGEKRAEGLDGTVVLE